jgi:hypothetical protein
MRENKSPHHKRERAKRLSTKNEGTDNKKNVNLQKSTSAHGMKVGYHSEAANIGTEKDIHGMKVGYHSEATNPSGHSNRLHKKRNKK